MMTPPNPGHVSAIAEFNITHIHEIAWDAAAMQSLVLGDAGKVLLSAMVASPRTQNADEFDDFVEGQRSLFCATHLPTVR
jgi:hypothetical protein